MADIRLTYVLFENFEKGGVHFSATLTWLFSWKLITIIEIWTTFGLAYLID